MFIFSLEFHEIAGDVIVLITFIYSLGTVEKSDNDQN